MWSLAILTNTYNEYNYPNQKLVTITEHIAMLLILVYIVHDMGFFQPNVKNMKPSIIPKSL